MMNNKEKKEMKNLKRLNLFLLILVLVCFFAFVFLAAKTPIYAATGYYEGLNKNTTICEILNMTTDGEY